MYIGWFNAVIPEKTAQTPRKYVFFFAERVSSILSQRLLKTTNSKQPVLIARIHAG